MAIPILEEEAIFHAARRIETADGRRRYLDDCCGGNADLRARVEALLRVHDQELSFLQTPADGPTLIGNVTLVRESPGAVIGPYRIVEQIGEGGFGIVFAAEQERPVRRTVALKLLKPGMDSAQVIARFEAERQA